jgi:hypothetical protein
MKKIFILFCLILGTSSIYAQFDGDFVETSVVTINNERYGYIKMSRAGQRVKVKYFASKEGYNQTVYERFAEWSRNKNIIAISSGTYMDDWNLSLAKPVGLCIDNGITVNRAIDLNRLDGLTIVYPSGGGGGVSVSNLKDGNLTVQGIATPLNLRNAFDLQRFISWGETNKATVFQSHLFVFKNQIILKPNLANTKQSERRFLAVGTNSEGQLLHYIVNLSGANSIYGATEKVFGFLTKNEELNVTFLINLDTGGQNAFKVYTSSGKVDARKDFIGTTPLNQAANLLVYYFE